MFIFERESAGKWGRGREGGNRDFKVRSVLIISEPDVGLKLRNRTMRS